MKINKLKINGYGKLKNKEIELKDNINIIYGENESGKSTVLKFIINSFYGASKNKKGKEISDFEKYLPWETEEFSGKVDYKLDNGNKFEVYREFKKKNPKIFNELSEDISKEFNIDKNKGNEFFYEQTKINEETFLSTAVIEQQEVKIEKNMQNILLQKISNLITTGKDNISYKKAIEKINKKQLEEIGTERSREKPINIVKEEIEQIDNQINKAEEYGNQQKNVEEEVRKLEVLNLHNTTKIELLQDINKIKNEEKIDQEKIKINEKIKNDTQNKINLLKKEQEKIKIEEKNNKEINFKENLEKNIKEKNKLNKKLIFYLIIIIFINIIQYILIKNAIIKNILILTVPTYLIFLYLFKNKLNKKIKKEEKNIIEENKIIENKIIKIENEINLLEKNKNETENRIIKIKNEINLKNKNNYEKIKNKYYKKIEENKNKNNSSSNLENNIIKIDEIEKDKTEKQIQEFLKLSYEDITEEVQKLQNETNKNEIEIVNLNIKKKNAEDTKIELEKLKENKVMLTNKYEKLCRKNTSLEMAKDAIIQAYDMMKNNVSPKFTENLSNNISTITNGRHNNIKFSDEEGLIVGLDNGNYVNANRLSIGTIDQLYLSLRIAILEEISEEKLPIILDETFAYYDEKRLKNILQYLNKQFNNRQIIIFTCTNREKEILEKLNIKFNLINI